MGVVKKNSIHITVSHVQAYSLDNWSIWSIADRDWIQKSLNPCTTIHQALKRNVKVHNNFPFWFSASDISGCYTKFWINQSFLSVYHPINFSLLKTHSCWKIVCKRLSADYRIQNTSWNWKLLRESNNHGKLFADSVNCKLILSVLLPSRNKYAVLSHWGSNCHFLFILQISEWELGILK